MDVDYQVIGGRIRKAREDKGITQELLAERIDVSNAYISKIERGKTAVNLDNLDKICTALNISIEFILKGTSTAADDPHRNDILEMLKGCTPAQIKLIAQIIQSIVDHNE